MADDEEIPPIISEDPIIQIQPEPDQIVALVIPDTSVGDVPVVESLTQLTYVENTILPPEEPPYDPGPPPYDPGPPPGPPPEEPMAPMAMSSMSLMAALDAEDPPPEDPVGPDLTGVQFIAYAEPITSDQGPPPEEPPP